MALESLGEAPEQVLHIAEGLCEAEPARSLGMGSVWVRRSDRSDDGSGAVPDARVGSLTEIVEAFELKNSMSR
jgi:FMN phosphatase YigB (HAD superfamily)